MSQWYDRVRELAPAYGVDPELAVRVMRQESGGNPNALSQAGAIGLMQLMPDTAAGLGVDPRDPEQNIRGGLEYLRQQKEKFGSWGLALAAYNAGPGAVEKHGGVPPYQETQQYVSKILGSGPPPSVQASFPTGTTTMPQMTLPPEISMEPPQMAEPSLTQRLSSNPFIQMGLGILADPTMNPARGAQIGLLAAAQAENAVTRGQDARARMELDRRGDALYQQSLRQQAIGRQTLSAAEAARHQVATQQLAQQQNEWLSAQQPKVGTLDPNAATPESKMKYAQSGDRRDLEFPSGGAGEKKGQSSETDVLMSLKTLEDLDRTLENDPAVAGLPGMLQYGGSAVIGGVSDLLKSALGWDLGGGERAADIAEFQTRAQVATSENARDIINQGDTRMSDNDIRLADALGKMRWFDPSKAARASVRVLAGLKWRRLLLNQGVPKAQIYEGGVGNPTELGTPPYLRRKGEQPPVTGGEALPGPSSGTPPSPIGFGGYTQEDENRRLQLESGQPSGTGGEMPQLQGGF